MLSWLDANDFSTAGAIGSWSDKSPGGNHATQGAGTQQPVVVLNQFNGRPVVRFDGANDYLATGNVSVPTTTVHAFIVADTTDTNGKLLDYQRGPGNTNLLYLAFFNGTGVINHGARFDGAGGNRAANAPGVWSAGTPGIISTLVRSDNSASLRVNGGTPHNIAAAGTALGTMNNPFVIGVQEIVAPTSNPFAGDVAEIIIFDTELTGDEQIGLEYQASLKWGLSGVPLATQAQIDASNALFPTGVYFLGPIPEPSTILIWSLLAGLGLAAGWRRRR
jgi:hypothetical protein